MGFLYGEHPSIKHELREPLKTNSYKHFLDAPRLNSLLSPIRAKCGADRLQFPRTCHLLDAPAPDWYTTWRLHTCRDSLATGIWEVWPLCSISLTRRTRMVTYLPHLWRRCGRISFSSYILKEKMRTAENNGEQGRGVGEKDFIFPLVLYLDTSGYGARHRDDRLCDHLAQSQRG